MSRKHEEKRRRKARRVWTRPPAKGIEWTSDEEAHDELEHNGVEFSAGIGAWTLRVVRAPAQPGTDAEYFASLWTATGDSRELGRFDDVVVAMKTCEDMATLLQACPLCSKPIETPVFDYVDCVPVHRGTCADRLREML